MLLVLFKQHTAIILMSFINKLRMYLACFVLNMDVLLFLLYVGLHLLQKSESFSKKLDCNKQFFELNDPLYMESLLDSQDPKLVWLHLIFCILFWFSFRVDFIYFYMLSTCLCSKATRDVSTFLSINDLQETMSWISHEIATIDTVDVSFIADFNIET